MINSYRYFDGDHKIVETRKRGYMTLEEDIWEGLDEEEPEGYADMRRNAPDRMTGRLMELGC